MAPIRAREAAEKQASDKALEAANLEKDDPERAAALYRESITIHRKLAGNSRDRFLWRDFPYLYNRLTLVLERIKRYDEALKEIEIFEKIRDQCDSGKSDKEAIQKRKNRLVKLLACANNSKGSQNDAQV